MRAERPDHIVVVGASLAGLRAIETARDLGYDGRITLVGDERHLPYDRPPLSKEVLRDGPHGTAHVLPSSARLAEELGVELKLGQPATALDADARTLEIGGAETVSYDAALIATGVRPRSLPRQHDLDGVHLLRTVDDAAAIHAALERGARTVVVGGGFIGAEVASAAVQRDLPVTIVEAAEVPLVRAVGTAAGRILSRLHALNGVELQCGVGVTEIVGSQRVEGVRLTNGSELPADLVVVGIGAAPNTEWLQGSSLTLDDGVLCDVELRAAPGVWAAGDVARWASPIFGRPLRLEHWTNAGEQAAHAVSNLLSPYDATPYDHVPYFWSDWYGHRIQSAGLPVGDPVLVSGSWEGDGFVALYREGDLLRGVLTLDRRGDVMKYRALIARRATWQDALDLAERRNAAPRRVTPARNPA